MADIVNLNRARKQKSRAEREQQAAENRVRFGRSKAEKARDAAEKSLAEKLVEAHRRDSD
ncbi:MAG: DUF4169 domain-containing protein [Devosia sp. 67-54]|uniref:DUF4169 family protein n=1 Tax=unclassified Devosia TaxID=196773 RepID=UPI0009675E97|nr:MULTISPECIES: DUF4169 family protein [unclassified Devosia]MBN9304336.1 DUF4169 family protein [Devosia sp.]OJX18142.1 MAG: DUF4169 domain-containing protein [Devosia sp. 67-54]